MTGVSVTHLKDFEVVLRFFYQLSDGKVHPLSVPGDRTALLGGADSR